MTDTPRCEPPEELRRRDGWHWLSRQGRAPELIRWHLASDGETWLWSVPGLGTAGRAWMVAQGFRYIAPVTPPAEVDALRAERDALEQQMLHEHQAAVDQYGIADALRDEVARLRGALEAIAAEDLLLGANPQAFGSSAAYRMQEQARAALSQPEGKE
jgi:hypothetical protein